MAGGGKPPELPDVLEPIVGGGEGSLVDVIDHLLDQGLVLDGDLVLGLAGIDLAYLRLSALLAAADRVLPHARREPPSSGPSGPADPAHPTAPEEPPRPRAPRQEPSPAPPVTDAARPVSRERVHPVAPDELEAVSRDLEQRPRGERPLRFDPDPEEVRRSVVKLVLTLVELIRDVLERQAIRRMEEETLAPPEVERLGQALMRLEETVHELAAQFGISPEELNLDLGPLGKLR